MRFDSIPADIVSIRVKPATPGFTMSNETILPVLSISASFMESDVFDLRLKGKNKDQDTVVSVCTVNAYEAKRLGDELLKGASHLAQICNPAADGSFDLMLATFPGNVLEMGDIELGVDETVELALNEAEHRSEKKQLSGEKLYKHLTEAFSYRQGEDCFFFMFAGPAVDREWDSASGNTDYVTNDIDEEYEEEDEDNEAFEKPVARTDVNENNSSGKNSFCVVGEDCRFIATKKTLTEDTEIFAISKFTSARNYRDRCLRLARGKLMFLDYTHTGKIGLLARAQLERLTQDSSSYLKKWDAYGNEEGELLLRHARHFGIISFKDKEQNKDGTTTVTIEASGNAIEDLKNNKIEALCITDETPSYIDNPSMTFPEFVGGILASSEEENKDKKSRFGEAEEKKKDAAMNKEENDSYEILSYSYETSTLVLKVDDLPYSSGLMVMALGGEIAQIKRRMTYRRLILEGRSANPQLGVLIEENGQISQLLSPHKVKPLSAFVREKVFKNDPTKKQVDAIQIALNTPDIALIQGPPGTGKTTVIAAILERLNEEADKHKKGKGRILLSGFQHDAVENMIERLSINGLPVPKFGQRSGKEKNLDYTEFQKRMEQWCADIAKRIREKNPGFPPLEKETVLNNMCIQYIMSPSAEYALKLVNGILEIGVPILGQELFDKASRIEKKLNSNLLANDSDHSLLDAIRGLRTKKESFCDDGAEQAEAVLEKCGPYLSDAEKAVVQEAAEWLPGDELVFLFELEKVKRSLLIRFTAPPVFRVEKHNQEIIELLEETVKMIRSNGMTSKDRKAAALLDFLMDLENNPYGMIDAIADYSFAFSATCQQCANKLMQAQKGVYGDNSEEKMEYDYVIIDEAARVSPRDLLIPMAQGKRIILVGDHRQLPHIIDEEVAKEMEAGEANQSETEWLKKSMFEYLFSERLKNLEEMDPEHPRRVTLNMQYRMHEVLGDFISRNFYERFDPDEKFGSGLPPEFFAHDLPDTENKPAAWLEVPRSMGVHERSGTSWIRRCEAKAIANRLERWMESEPGKKLSYGVISFYKAQAELIQKQLSRQFDTRKLRIGTVDSFQGMEFDVVFLSMVRTLPPDFSPAAAIERSGKRFMERYPDSQPLTEQEQRQLAAQSAYGHLCLYNRLNVSMSRQKKMLVVVGDSNALHNELAEEFIPGLVDFYKLCKENGVILSCK